MPTRTVAAIMGFLVVLGAVTALYISKSAAAERLSTQDLLDIQQLYSRYYQTIDAGDSEAWANTFTPDGVFNTNTRGHDALVESNRRGGRNRPLRHWHSNLIVTPSPEGAKGSVYVMQIDITTKPPTIATYSRYDDTLVKTSQGWRFKTRQRSSDTTIVSTR